MNFYEVNKPESEILTNIVREQKERFDFILDKEWRRLVVASNFNIVVPHSEDLIKTLGDIFRAVFNAHEELWNIIYDSDDTPIKQGLDLNDLIEEFIPIGDLVECGQVGGYEAWTGCMMNALTEGMNRRFKEHVKWNGEQGVDLEVYYKVIDDDDESFYDYVECLCWRPSVVSSPF